MIRKKSLFCKLFFNKISSKEFYDASMSHFRPELEACPFCGARGHCRIHAYYNRWIIGFTNGQRTEDRVSVLRVKCSSCGHTHAVLPDVIIPYDSYSLLFILMVLAERFLLHLTVEKICERFSITPDLFYKWLHLWRKHKRDWLGILTDDETSDSAFMGTLLYLEPFSDFSSAFVRLYACSFLQSHRNPTNCRHHRLRGTTVF